jgi:hypothetical protein
VVGVGSEEDEKGRGDWGEEEGVESAFEMVCVCVWREGRRLAE